MIFPLELNICSILWSVDLVVSGGLCLCSEGGTTVFLTLRHTYSCRKASSEQRGIQRLVKVVQAYSVGAVILTSVSPWSWRGIQMASADFLIPGGGSCLPLLFM